MWFTSLYGWILELFVGKAVEEIVDGAREHIEPEESDWDWSKSADANPDLKEISLVIRDIDASLFLGEIESLVTRGFDSAQIIVLMRQIEKLNPGEHTFVEFYIKAFERGTQLKIVAQRLDAEHLGFIFWTDSALSFEIAQLQPKFDQADKEVVVPPGLN